MDGVTGALAPTCSVAASLPAGEESDVEAAPTFRAMAAAAEPNVKMPAAVAAMIWRLFMRSTVRNGLEGDAADTVRIR